MYFKLAGRIDADDGLILMTRANKGEMSGFEDASTRSLDAASPEANLKETLQKLKDSKGVEKTKKAGAETGPKTPAEKDAARAVAMFLL